LENAACAGFIFKMSARGSSIASRADTAQKNFAAQKKVLDNAK
jgi:hypothetical protein